MTTSADRSPLEEQIEQWRLYLRRRRAIHGPDVEELEGHLRDQIAVFTEAGLAADEAFLVAVKRMGSLDALSREFAREHSERLWKQLVIAPEAAAEPGNTTRTETLIVLSLAVAAAVAIKVPALFGLQLGGGDEPFYARNASLFVLPPLTAYFAWKRGTRRRDRDLRSAHVRHRRDGADDRCAAAHVAARALGHTRRPADRVAPGVKPRRLLIDVNR
jgi:hypothetical protein